MSTSHGTPSDAAAAPKRTQLVGGTSPDVDAWRGMLRDCLIRLDAIPIGGTGDGDGYTGWLRQLDLGCLTLTDVGSDPVRVVRAPRMLVGNQDDFYLLSMALEDSASHCGDVQSQLGRGDAVLLDSTAPFQLSAAERAHHLVLTLPRADVARVLPASRERVGRRIAAQNPVLRVLRATLAEVHAGGERFDPGLLPELGYVLRELLFSVLRSDELTDQAGVNGLLGHHAQLLRMRDFIQRHIADPELSAKVVAAAFGVSVRYVELVFRESGTSPARYIRQTRMEEARRSLASPQRRQRPIAAIARSVGIENPTVFARMFRHFYDVTPSDYRRSQAGGEHRGRSGG
ncbi:helix-turn-helix domain-containing protein [Streptomyces sp. 8K308]|uniref:helix-turn-helix domain-containing protein n=1 Tax=Streptomyces sp. 8K308 TaxID=2530388 RepID=UPI001043A145|nr:helix-turn-helix domain-containing protein [Streptomyces sp. 8K308]TDC20500.1 helix-turn-helix domain-containing protein [Streptomyces sp. 8K308]